MATAEKKKSGAQAFRESQEKKLDETKATAYVAKATGKEFTAAKYKWYLDLYNTGKLGGAPAAALKKKLGTKTVK